jgi:ATP/maltotriose-dependent transcriptional regulator MalT
LERDILALKLCLCQRLPRAGDTAFVSTSYSDLPRASHGQFLALQALARATVGNAEQACSLSEQALELTGSVEARYFANLAQLIVHCTHDRRKIHYLVGAVSRFLEAAKADDFLDAVVVGYRIYPRFLRLAAQDASNVATLQRLVRLARDESSAQAAGLPSPSALATRANVLNTLTPRETEILSLLNEGLSNIEISKKLFIAPSTTKIHVRHVLRKLGVNNRVQAILRTRELEL